MTTLEKIDNLIEVYENPNKYRGQTMLGLCYAYLLLFKSYDMYYHIDPSWSQLLKLAKEHPRFIVATTWFRPGDIAPRLEILKQYRKQLTDGITKH